MVPDPVAFWIEELEGKDELEVEVDDVEDLGVSNRGFEGVGGDLTREGGEFVGVNLASVVPDCVVFGVLLEEDGGFLEEG